MAVNKAVRHVSKVTMLLAALATPIMAQSGPQSAGLRIQVLTDIGTPAAGEALAIFCTGLSEPIVMTTGTHGESSLATVSTDGIISLTLQETHLTEGVALGQFLEFPGPVPGSGIDWTHRIVTQPLAVPVTISSANPTTSGHHLRWIFRPIEQLDGSIPRYRFAAHVAILLTSAEVSAYRAYGGLNSPNFDGALGLVIRCNSVDLGQENVSLQLDCRGHGFPAAPSAKCFIVRGPTQGLPSPTFSAEVVGWEDEQALLVVNGVLERGDNVILIQPGTTSIPAERLERSEEELVVPPPTESAPGSGPQCSPPDGPECLGNDYSSSSSQPPCTPSPVPTSDSGCPAPVASQPKCSGWGVGGYQLCGYSGTTAAQSVSATVGGSVSVSASSGVPGNTVSVTATGSVSTTVSATVTIACQNGSGDCSACSGTSLCGTCARLCLKLSSCYQDYKVTKNGKRVKRWAELGLPHVTYETVPCSETSTVTAYCLNIDGIQQELCDRHCP